MVRSSVGLVGVTIPTREAATILPSPMPPLGVKAIFRLVFSLIFIVAEDVTVAERFRPVLVPALRVEVPLSVAVTLRAPPRLAPNLIVFAAEADIDKADAALIDAVAIPVAVTLTTAREL